jgi:hypothetical protein
MSSNAQGNQDEVSVLAVGIYHLLKAQTTSCARTWTEKLFLVKGSVLPYTRTSGYRIDLQQQRAHQKLLVLNTY